MTTMGKRLGIAALGLLTVSGLALAGPGRGHGLRELVQSLDLNEQQLEQVEVLREDTHAFHEAQRARKDAVADGVLAELEKARPDKQKLHDLIDDSLDGLREGLHERLDAFLDFHSTLTDAQRTELVDGLEQLRAEREAHHEQMRGHHGPGGEGPGGEGPDGEGPPRGGARGR